MEQARRIYAEDETATFANAERAAPLTDSEQTSASIEKVLRFATPVAKPAEAEAGPRPTSPVTARELAAAMDFVHDAAAMIRAAEERAREAEARTQSVAQRAAEELKTAELRIQSLEGRLRAAEARGQDAETRAKEADGWLRQIFATIAEELPPPRRPA